MYKENASDNVYLDDSIQHDGRLRLAQLKMLEMLKVIDDICQQHQLDYWLDRGTLLGAVRDQKFIPWDDDVDISMPRKSYDAFIQLAPSCLPEHLWLQTMHTDPGYFNLAAPLKIRDRNSLFIEKHEKGDEPYQQGIFIDIFPYDVVPQNVLVRKVYKFIGKKLWRLLNHKYSAVELGNHARIYKIIGYYIPKSFLMFCLESLIKTSNQKASSFWGYGYDSTKNICITHDTIYPLKRIGLEGAEFNIVNHPEIILSKLYGDYLTLPPENQRKANHCKKLIISLS